MLPVKTERSNMVYRGTTPNIADLDCERIAPGHIRSVWKPSDEERAYITAGGNLELDILTEPIPPVALNVTDEAAEWTPTTPDPERKVGRRERWYGRSRANSWPLWSSWLLAPSPSSRRIIRELMQLRRAGKA